MVSKNGARCKNGGKTQKWGGDAKMGWRYKNGVEIQKWGGDTKMGWRYKNGVEIQKRSFKLIQETAVQQVFPPINKDSNNY